MVNGGRRNETGKRIESFFVFALAAETNSGTDAGQVDVAQVRAFQIVDADFGARVFQIAKQKDVVDERRGFQFIGTLRDDRLPFVALGMALYRWRSTCRGARPGRSESRRPDRHCR